jgi:DNA-directed RNA polymerase subunit RPC12/RpoP
MRMANCIKRGEKLLIPFRNGTSIGDSQGKPRMYKTMTAFRKSFPGHYLGTEDVDLVEYAEVVHGYWDGYECSICGGNYMDYADADSYPAIGEPKPKYCPDCGSKMDRGDGNG